MTQEDKELLLKDLCSRFPYNTICQVEFKNCGKYENKNMTLSGIFKDEAYFTIENGSVYSNNYKPYLFPLSSVTDEQKEEYRYIIERWMYDSSYSISDITDWLNKNHFDYRGLIEKGLAIDATGKNIYWFV